MHVLLVEDNRGDQRLVARSLRRQSHTELHIADDGVEALAFLRRQGEHANAPTPDFVLMDLKLPRKGGLEVLADIKRDPDLRHIPVIVLSSSDAPGDVSAAYAHHACAYFVKPVANYDDVIDRILAFMHSAIFAPSSDTAVPVVRAAKSTIPRAAWLASIVDSAADAIISTDLDGSVVSWNGAAERLYGYTAAEAIGRNICLVVPDDRRTELESLLSAVRRGEQVSQLDTERVDRGGNRRIVSLTLAPIRDEHGNIIGKSALARDVTEQKQAELRFRLAVESAPSAMMMVDPAGAIVLLNTEAERMFGYVRGELVGKSVDLLVPPRYRAGHPNHRGAFLNRPEARAMGAGRDLYAVRKDGSDFPVEIGLNPIDTPDGTFVLSAIVDITERKQAEERFRLAVESSPNGMIMIGADGHIVLVNAETERMFGYSRDELIGETIDVLVPSRFRRDHPHHRSAFMSTPEARIMGAGRDLYAVRKDGSEFPVEIGLNPIETRRGIFVLSAIVDITERKRAEEALARQTHELARSNAELEQFASVASHDLQEPLRMVASFTELLDREYRDQLDDTGREYIDFAMDGAVRMQRLIRDLLTYSRVSSGREQVARIPLADAVASAVGNLRMAVDEANATIDVADMPTVTGRGTLLVQLLQNLIANAVKFRSERPPRVEISAAAEHNGWRVQVADNGIGIPSEYQDEVFLVFRRLHGRDRYPGTGIGLAICKRIVEHHGGQIWLDSSPGEGTTVHFWLPDDLS